MRTIKEHKNKQILVDTLLNANWKQNRYGSYDKILGGNSGINVRIKFKSLSIDIHTYSSISHSYIKLYSAYYAAIMIGGGRLTLVNNANTPSFGQERAIQL